MRHNRVKRTMRMVLVCLAVALCFGCGYKDELERQKQQVDRLHSEVQRLSETLGSLEKEKTRLGDDLKVLAEKNASLQTEAADLKKAKDSSEADNAKLTKRNSELQDELDSLKRQKTDLEREVGELNKKLSESPSPQGSSQAQPPGSGPQAVPGRVSAGPPPPNPCDTVIVFMKQSAQIIKLNKGNRRTKRLAQLRQELAKGMEGAPPKAVKSAEAWVNELSATWDKRNDDSVYKLLTLRNAALEACGMKPQEVGF